MLPQYFIWHNVSQKRYENTTKNVFQHHSIFSIFNISISQRFFFPPPSPSSAIILGSPKNVPRAAAAPHLINLDLHPAAAAKPRRNFAALVYFTTIRVRARSSLCRHEAYQRASLSSLSLSPLFARNYDRPRRLVFADDCRCMGFLRSRAV